MAIVARWRGTRPRSRNRGMNKLEAAYFMKLENMKLAGEISDYRYEPIKLRLADKTFFTPDFFVVRPLGDGTVEYQLHETKGFMEEDANVKLKVAAEQFPWFRFLLVKRVKGQWETTEV